MIAREGWVIEFWVAVPTPLDMVIHAGLRDMLPFWGNRV